MKLHCGYMNHYKKDMIQGHNYGVNYVQIAMEDLSNFVKQKLFSYHGIPAVKKKQLAVAAHNMFAYRFSDICGYCKSRYLNVIFLEEQVSNKYTYTVICNWQSSC